MISRLKHPDRRRNKQLSRQSEKTQIIFRTQIEQLEAEKRDLTLRNIENEKTIKKYKQRIDQNQIQQIDALLLVEQQYQEERKKNEENQKVISTLTRCLKKAQREKQQYRFAAIALKNLARNLPAARINSVQWAKCGKLSASEHITVRSLSLENIRKLIHRQHPYSQLSVDQFIIGNNPLNTDCQYKTERLKQIQSFVELNGIGNINPKVMDFELNDVVGIRKITKCHHASILNGQKECFAKMNIANGTILGQYVGNEMLKEEYHEIYNGTMEEMEHLTFMHGDTLQLPNGNTIEIYVDGIGAGDSSPFLYINDGRADIRGEETKEDKGRMNVQFVIVLCNGWPMILIRSCKAIKAGDSLWINYGPRFGLVLDEQALVYDQKRKTIRSVEQILKGIDLVEEEPLYVFGDDDKDESIPSIKMSKTGDDMEDSDIEVVPTRSEDTMGTSKSRKRISIKSAMPRVPPQKRQKISHHRSDIIDLSMCD